MASIVFHFLIWTSAVRNLLSTGLSTSGIDYYGIYYPDVALPRSVAYGAIGCSTQNNKVLVFGGYLSPQSLITVDTETYNMKDEGEFYLDKKGVDVNIPSNNDYIAQFYTQVDNHLYIQIRDENSGNGVNSFYRVDVDTLDVEILRSTSPFPYFPEYDLSFLACLTSYKGKNGHDYIISIGNYDVRVNQNYQRAAIHIYDITGNEWSYNGDIPPMIYGRDNPGCITLSDKLYAIGGDNELGRTLDTVEMVPLSTDLGFLTYNPGWSLLADRLSWPRAGTRVISYLTDILIIGGYGEDKSCVDPGIEVIDTLTNTIRQKGALTSYIFTCPTVSVPVIMCNDKIFSFSPNTVDARRYGYKGLNSLNPTLSPTPSPTGVPTVKPTPVTLYPTKKPTKAPTPSPTESPTNQPSVSPTTEPTFEPTVDPTVFPTSIPSISPTRNPTQADAYDAYINIVYGLQGLTLSNVQKITNNATKIIGDIERIIEFGYVNEKSVVVTYEKFWCRILSINDYKIAAVNSSFNDELSNANTLGLQTRIECNEAECNNLIESRDQNTFEATVTNSLSDYFGSNQALRFYEIQTSNVTLKYIPNQPIVKENLEEEEINYIFLALLGVTLMIIMLGFLACCYNDDVCCDFPRIKGCYIVDDGKFTALIVFALHFYDFTSDINLCREIWLENDAMNDLWIFIAGVGSVLFLLIPYMTNLYVAANIKNMIKNNESARSWFQFYSKTFTFFVVLTGGCYPALLLVSSNVFGMNIFSSGLTQYELKNMAQIRLFATIFLENIPQIALQLFYSAAIEKLTTAVIFSFVASTLSILSTVLSYCIDRNDENTKVFTYYLVTGLNCHQRSIVSPKSSEGDNTLNSMEDPVTGPIKLKPLNSVSVSFVADNQITEKERISLLKNKGRRKKLSMEMSELFGVPIKNIQIGNSTITKHGLITYIVHFVYRSDLKQMALEKKSRKVSVRDYIDGLYSSLSEEINDIFRKHFDVNEDFDVGLKYNLSMKARTSTVHLLPQKSIGDDDVATEMTSVNKK